MLASFVVPGGAANNGWTSYPPLSDLAPNHGQTMWLIGMISTIAMAALGFVLVSVSPRRYGRSNAQTVVQSTATLVRFLRLVLGPVTNWLASIA